MIQQDTLRVLREAGCSPYVGTIKTGVIIFLPDTFLREGEIVLREDLDEVAHEKMPILVSYRNTNPRRGDT